MMFAKKSISCLLITTALLSACGGTEQESSAPAAAVETAQSAPVQAANVTAQRLLDADADGANWMSNGRTHEEHRSSPLTAVNAENVTELGLAWAVDLDTRRGQESTPLVIDGVMYTSTAWSLVTAINAATGEVLWTYDPQVPRETLIKVCCDAVNRGVAAYEGKIIVGTLDGRLIALDAATGQEVWNRRMFPVESDYASTGAPRMAKDMVLLGSAGAEYNARGWISAYDVNTGEERWRFYTIPGNPADGFENAAMERAASTWTGEWWKLGGGGTVWDSITYDPQLNLVIFGTANAEPWSAEHRSPEGGDNLYSASVVALDADTGEYRWHFQETPQDRWDYDSTQHIIVADVDIAGESRRVVLHAPKNGFFYVLDAATGEFISGEKFAKTVTWAESLDEKGYPVYNPDAFYDKTGEMFISFPGALGAHSWQPMSYSKKTGLVYIPVNEAGYPYKSAGPDWEPAGIGFETAQDSLASMMPADAEIRKLNMDASVGTLLAWDPIQQKEAWRVDYVGPWNGGTLVTDGNLVFQGTAGSEFRAYRADNGELLWSFPTQTGVIAAPMTYSVDGEQYVAIQVGWGGVWDLATGVLADKSGHTRNISRVLAFKIGGTAQLPPEPPLEQLVLDPPPVTGTDEQIAQGAAHYQRFCAVCHGDAAIAGGINPDLRHSGVIENPEALKAIVVDGALKHRGMVAFEKVLGPEDSEAIRHFLIKRANEDMLLEKAARANQMAAAVR